MHPCFARCRFVACAFLLLTGLVTLPACKGASEGIVTGQVKLDNEPLTFATVYFVSGDGKTTCACNVDANGAYRMEKVPVGTVKIKVVTYPPVPLGLANAKGPNTPKGQKKATPAIEIPPKYNDEKTSGLTHDVKSGEDKRDILLSRR